jgi:hypothetical protein
MVPEFNLLAMNIHIRLMCIESEISKTKDCKVYMNKNRENIYILIVLFLS